MEGSWQLGAGHSLQGQAWVSIAVSVIILHASICADFCFRAQAIGRSWTHKHFHVLVLIIFFLCWFRKCTWETKGTQWAQQLPTTPGRRQMLKQQNTRGCGRCELLTFFMMLGFLWAAGLQIWQGDALPLLFRESWLQHSQRWEIWEVSLLTYFE